MRGLLLFGAVLLVVSCTTPRSSFSRARVLFPPDALITQRGVLNAGGKQFTLNGYLSLSPSGGARLIVMENFGSVLADVLVQTNGTAHVMRSSPAFRASWIERYMAEDVKCLLGWNVGATCHIEMPGTNHFVIKRFWYSLDLHTVETKPGPQPAAMFEPPQKP